MIQLYLDSFPFTSVLDIFSPSVTISNNQGTIQLEMNKLSKEDDHTTVGTAVLELLLVFLLGRKNLWM